MIDPLPDQVRALWGGGDWTPRLGGVRCSQRLGDLVTVVELFAGAGGAALGLSRAGYAHLALCEIDPSACATLRAAGYSHVIEGDLREVDWSGRASPDLIWASPPCQAWSAAGRRQGARDERNGWPWTWETLDQLSPRWFVAENVPGLLHHLQTCGDPSTCSGCYWEREILPAARRRFGWVAVWLLNAADYGVPQIRRRVILVAGPGPVAPPPPTHADPAELLHPGLFDARRPWRTVREALGFSGWPEPTGWQEGN